MTSRPTTDTEAEWAQIQAAFDPVLWSSPNSVNDVQRNALLREYRDGIEQHRGQGCTEMEARKRSLQAITDVWGISSVSDTSDRLALVPLPPEKVYCDKAINGNFEWIREQAAEVLGTYLVEMGRMEKPPKHEKPIACVPFMLVPKPGSLYQFRKGHHVTYDILYLDHNNTLQKAVGVFFVPHYTAAVAKADEASQSAVH
ncbi:MAG: hypothetical protein AB7O71_10795 [Hyphomicrobiaceae bacterium]